MQTKSPMPAPRSTNKLPGKKSQTILETSSGVLRKPEACNAPLSKLTRAYQAYTFSINQAQKEKPQGSPQSTLKEALPTLAKGQMTQIPQL